MTYTKEQLKLVEDSAQVTARLIYKMLIKEQNKIIIGVAFGDEKATELNENGTFLTGMAYTIELISKQYKLNE